MEFKEIKNEEDMQVLMKEFSCFHDSCIKEIKYISGCYVDKDRSMQPINNVRKVVILFQSQMAQNRTLEMHFEKISKMFLQPQDERYDGIIYEASIKQFDNLFYWCDWENLKKEDIEIVEGTWISAERIIWRFEKE